jgi:hypothetical protein
MKKLQKLDLVKKSVVELGNKQTKELKGGYGGCRTMAHNTQVNTCFTYNCCTSQGCSS